MPRGKGIYRRGTVWWNRYAALVERFGKLPLRYFSTRIVEEYQTERLTSGNKPATVTFRPCNK